ncbi:hypothetical protein MHBO_004954 [Bonamia ostreae]|uniref:Uncharacterized protein n=1 Tax=Bonamia ostreae TaxID=126728 RepID=A0ABV2AUN9_9EUKA
MVIAMTTPSSMVCQMVVLKETVKMMVMVMVAMSQMTATSLILLIPSYTRKLS